MPDFTFRQRVLLAPSSRLGFAANRHQFQLSRPNCLLTLKSADRNIPIERSAEIVLTAGGFESEEAARSAGQEALETLKLAFAKLSIGADFGERGARSFVTNIALKLMSDASGARVLRDEPFLMAYEADPEPLFVRTNDCTATMTIQGERIERACRLAGDRPSKLSERETSSLELLSAAKFLTSLRARFLMLFMAMEALVEPRPRSLGTRKHLEQLRHVTKQAIDLNPEDRRALLGVLGSLEQESGFGAAQRFVGTRLANEMLLGTPAQQVLKEAFRIRHPLVHGGSSVTDSAIGSVTTQLQTLVERLLTVETIPQVL